MRIKNLLIIIAIVAAILLIIRYVSQVRDNRRGYNFVSNSRIFVNWLLVIILVGSLVGIGITSFTGHKESTAPAPAKTSKSSSAVEPADDDDDDITLSFKKTAHLNSDGVVKVKFLISPRTKVTIRGHRSGIVVETFKPSKADGTVTRSFTFDTAGTYDIIARRGDQKVVKHLKIKEAAEKASSSSSSFSAVSSTSTSSSSSIASSQSSTSAASRNDNTSTGSTGTSQSTNGSVSGSTGGNYYRGGTGYRSSNSNNNTNPSRSGGDASASDGQGTPSTGNGVLNDQP